MGLDYSYLLYFPRSRLWEVLDGLCDSADPTGPPTRINLPGAIMQFPFEAWAGTPGEIDWDRLAPELNFMTVLKFEPDAALEEYVVDNRDDPVPPGAPIRVGYIYLTVFTDLAGAEFGETDGDLVLFQFTAASTNMSILLAESGSIRATFNRLLAAHKGVCGLIDREYNAELVWWRGRETATGLPDARMSLAEIETHLAGGSEDKSKGT